MQNTKLKNFLFIVFLIALGMVVWAVLIQPDQRTAGERIGDAVDAMPQGLDKAARELESRTPGERLGDAVKDAGENIKKSTD